MNVKESNKIYYKTPRTIKTVPVEGVTIIFCGAAGVVSTLLGEIFPPIVEISDDDIASWDAGSGSGGTKAQSIRVRRSYQTKQVTRYCSYLEKL